MTPRELVTRIREYFEADPLHWTKYRHARRQDGSSCFWKDEDAVSFCMLGAIRRFGDDGDISVAALQAIQQSLPYPGRQIENWNDSLMTLWPDVVEILKSAEARLADA